MNAAWQTFTAEAARRALMALLAEGQSLQLHPEVLCIGEREEAKHEQQYIVSVHVRKNHLNHQAGCCSRGKQLEITLSRIQDSTKTNDVIQLQVPYLAREYYPECVPERSKRQRGVDRRYLLHRLPRDPCQCDAVEEIRGKLGEQESTE